MVNVTDTKRVTESKGFSALVAPLMSLAVKRAMSKDLLGLKKLLETTSS
ncbi:MAG: hypothetical protein HOV80_33330 [Polyangiaceae bacterium]|nr:hypothetical protein [Polyangiaceae bacterium]